MTDLLLLTYLPLGKPVTFTSRVCPGRLRSSSAVCDTQRDPDAKSFLSYLILSDTLVVPQVSACCKTPGSWLPGDESHSAWTAKIGTDPFQSREGPELTIGIKNVPLLLVHEQLKNTRAVVCGVQVCVHLTAVNMGQPAITCWTN